MVRGPRRFRYNGPLGVPKLLPQRLLDLSNRYLPCFVMIDGEVFECFDSCFGYVLRLDVGPEDVNVIVRFALFEGVVPRGVVFCSTRHCSTNGHFTHTSDIEPFCACTPGDKELVFDSPQRKNLIEYAEQLCQRPCFESCPSAF